MKNLKVADWCSTDCSLHHSPCILSFMCSYYRQQVIVHQEVTYCWVTENKKQRAQKSSKDTCSFRIRWCQFAKLSSVHMSSHGSALSQSPWLLRQLKGLLELECNKRCLKVQKLKRSSFYPQEAWCDQNTTNNPFHKITTQSPSHRRT